MWRSRVLCVLSKSQCTSKTTHTDCVITMGSTRGSPSSMAASVKPLLPSLLLLIFISAFSAADPTPTPAPWPHQFHSILSMNYSGALSLIDLWYDWPGGRNFNIIQDQLAGPPLYDLEWNNGTSFVYTLEEPFHCRTAQLEVGILRPNWLDGANYLGQKTVDGFLCNAWEKADFIVYYEDVATKRPVHWVFYTGRAAHVMTFEVGAVLEDIKWQAPVYCFDKKAVESRAVETTTSGGLTESWMKMKNASISTLPGLSSAA